MHFLIIDAQYPMFDRASADVRMMAILKLLVEDGHQVDYYAFALEKAIHQLGEAEISRYASGIRAIGVTVVVHPDFESALGSTVYDVVFFKYFYPAESRVPNVRRLQPQARVVIDSVDIVHARLLSKARLSGDEAEFANAKRVMRRELATYAAADLVIAVSDDEADILRRELPQVHISVIPNIHLPPTFQRQESPQPSLLFVGTFTHEPNLDALRWFCSDIWPRLRHAHPTLSLSVVGSWPPPEVASLEGNEGISILGHVADLSTYLRTAWVSIAPLRFGAGLKGKVGEALAAGIPVVTTTIGAQGFGVTPRQHLLVADDAADFAHAIDTLLRDKAERSTIGWRGRDFIETHYGIDAARRHVSNFIEGLRAPPKPRTQTATVHNTSQNIVRRIWNRLSQLMRLKL